jgi:hypothetical protein
MTTALLRELRRIADALAFIALAKARKEIDGLHEPYEDASRRLMDRILSDVDPPPPARRRTTTSKNHRQSRKGKS